MAEDKNLRNHYFETQTQTQNQNQKSYQNQIIEQVQVFKTGNEMVAEAARLIDFHFMGYYPITPSTEIAQLMDAMKSAGEIRTVLLAADGEHGAAGACLGASTAGARVLNATSANGFLFSLEQLPVQAGLRLPMVLNLVTRSVSGPLDIRCDHSDLMYALQTGWIILCASTPQEVYDLNIMAVKLGEHPEVRLPVMVVSDGFFTSHQRQSSFIFKDKEIIQNFLGPVSTQNTTLDPRNPVTVGPYMNDPDLINNKYQLHQAHLNAQKIFQQIGLEYEKISGRKYSALEVYGDDEANAGVFLLNSAAETAKEIVDQKNLTTAKVKLLRARMLRPFPSEEITLAAGSLKRLVIGERADTAGSTAGPLSHEIKSCLMSSGHGKTEALCRVYGLGGKDFTEVDAESFFDLALSIKKEEAFAFLGTYQGSAKSLPEPVLPPLNKKSLSAELVKVIQTDSIDKKESQINLSEKRIVIAEAKSPSDLVERPKRMTPGHGACPGCGIFSGLDQFFKGISGDVVVLYHTGCAMVVTTDYPYSAHRVTYLHNLFQNGAPTLAGLAETFLEKKRRRELDLSEEITFLMITGDGGMDIGMGPSIGTALRNHGMIILEYDNQGYMNTGGQLSYTTPKGKVTSTSHAGRTSFGKTFHHKDSASIMAATGIPYVFTAVESLGTDLVEKAAKAQWFAQNHGLVYGKLLVSCPLNWKSEEKEGLLVLEKVVNSCFFPIYEIQDGLTTLNVNPELNQQKIPVSQWIERMGVYRHLLKPENSQHLQDFQIEVDRRWERLKARAQHPLL